MLHQRLLNRLKFQIEDLLVRGPLSRVSVIGGVIVLVSISGGYLAFRLTGNEGGITKSIWWAFLRLTDPGYLGDDEGAALRIISTVITILGYVLFMGALIAVMTQWLNQTMARLALGLTAIVKNNHILILGFNNRTPTIVHELFLTEGRVRRFLALQGASKLDVVILAEEVSPELIQELRDRLGPAWRPRQVTLRSGEPLRVEHLRRVDYLNAAAILLPSPGLADVGVSAPDAKTIKTLVSLAHAEGEKTDPSRLPLMVTEITDVSKLPTAAKAYGGPIEVIASQLLISRLVVQTVRHRGMSDVITELLSREGQNSIFIRQLPTLVGCSVRRLMGGFDRAVLLGIVRPNGTQFDPLLNPAGDILLEADDRLVLLSRSFEECVPMDGFAPKTGADEVHSVRRPPSKEPARKVLLLGWSRKSPSLIQEFDSYETDAIEVDCISVVPEADRTQTMARQGVDAKYIRLRHIEGDYTSGPDLRRLDIASYDNVVVLASDWVDTEEESDARSILGHLMLREIAPVADDAPKPQILVELLDPGNAGLFRHSRDESLVSPLLLSHILTQVALRRELRAVIDNLFSAGGSNIMFRSAGYFGLSGEQSFEQIQTAVRERGGVALGLQPSGQPAVVNPDHQAVFPLGDQDFVVVLGVE